MLLEVEIMKKRAIHIQTVAIERRKHRSLLSDLDQVDLHFLDQTLKILIYRKRYEVAKKCLV